MSLTLVSQTMSCAHATCTCTGRLSHPKCASNVSVLRLQSGSCVEEMATTLVLEENALQMHLHNVFRTLCRKPCTEDSVSTLLPEKRKRKKSMNYICTVSSEQRTEDRAATLLPEERASNVSVLCLHSCAPGHVWRSGLSP